MELAPIASGRLPSDVADVRFQLKCKWKGGCALLPGLTGLATFDDLRRAVATATGLQPDNVLIKTGYPPTPICAKSDDLMRDLGFASGSTIVVEESAGGAVGEHDRTSQLLPPPTRQKLQEAVAMAVATAVPPSVAPQVVQEVGGPMADDRHTSSTGRLMRKRVPKDNSCFFTSMAFCMGEREDSLCAQTAAQLRESVSAVVLSGQEAYSEAILGRPPHDYAAWIRDPASWGGGIEAAILAELYGLEIVVVDIETCRPQHFGQQQAGNAQRIMLLYDGGHYDPLCREFSDDGSGVSSRDPSTESPLQTQFSRDDNSALYEAIAIAGRARAAGEYVRADVRKIRLRCRACAAVCDGTAEANDHVSATGHINFDQVGN